MKTHLLLLPLVLGLQQVSFGQSSASLFRPTQINYYYPNTSSMDWELATVRSFVYNVHGDPIVAVTSNGAHIPQTIDSLTYTPNNQLETKVALVWNASRNSFVYSYKLVNLYTGGIPTGSLMYHWDNGWQLQTGSEQVRSWDENLKEATEITKIYNKQTDQWKPLTKSVTKYNSQNQKERIVHYTSDMDGNFQYYTRESYGGWHNYDKNIYTSYKRERYENGSWTVETQSNVSKVNELWVENEERFWGPTAGNYKHLYKDDTSYRELMKQGFGGWLALSVFTRENRIEKIVQNHFTGDVLLKTEIDENELDAFGNLIRTMERIQVPGGQTTKFTQVKHGLIYNPQNLLMVDSSLVATSEGGAYVKAEKIVYANYVDVKLQTGIREWPEQKEGISLYPNPSKGIVHISTNGPILHVHAYDALGTLVKNLEVWEDKIDVGGLAKGVYQLRIATPDHTFSRKIMVETY